MSDDTKSFTMGCVTVAVLFGTLVFGASSCISKQDEQMTARITSACAGDLNDATRSAVCTLALTQRSWR